MTEFDKNLIKANKCIIGETYYLTGVWFDYGDLLQVGVMSAVAKSTNMAYKEPVKFKKPKCMINTPVKFKGKVGAIPRGVMGCRKGFEFELPDGEKVHSYAHGQLFKKPYIYKKEPIDELIDKYGHWHAISRNDISDVIYFQVIKDLKELKKQQK